MNQKDIASNCSTIKEFTAVINYLNAALQKVSNYAQHMDTQANIMIAISSALFVFSASKIYLPDGKISWPIIIIAIFSGMAELIALLSINPPRLMQKKQKESIFYHRSISSLSSQEEYYNQVIATTGNICNIIKEYTNEIYNIAKNSYLPKRRLFRLSRNLLVIGMTLSALTFLSQHIFHFP